MRRAIFRAIYTRLTTVGDSDSTSQRAARIALLGDLGLTITSTPEEVLSVILPRIPTDDIISPRLIIMSNISGSEDFAVPFLDKKRFRVLVQTKDQTGFKNDDILGNVRQLLDEYTPPILDTDNVRYWDVFRWERDGTPSILHASTYEDYHDYTVSCLPRNSNRLGE